MTSVNVMDTVESSSLSLHLPPEEVINQVGYISKLSNCNRWQDINDLVLDVITIPERGAQEIPTPHTSSIASGASHVTVHKAAAGKLIPDHFGVKLRPKKQSQ